MNFHELFTRDVLINYVRFRTCFPKEYKNHFGRDKSETPITGGKASDLATILVEDPDPDFKQDMSNGKVKGRTRRRNSNSPTLDVAERLGFPNSFPKAPRRERKPFSQEEDDALLRGFEVVSRVQRWLVWRLRVRSSNCI